MSVRSATAALAALASLHSSVAQQSAPAFRTETRLVVLHATVKTGRGADVANLDQRAFAVYENGKRQPIKLFRRDDIPVSLGLLIDNSGSMRTLRRRVEAAALAFVRASNPLDEAFVLNFADKPRIDVPFTSDVQTLEAGISRADSIGGTALRDAIDMADTYLGQHAVRDRRVLLVITDGRDNANRDRRHRRGAGTANPQSIHDRVCADESGARRDVSENPCRGAWIGIADRPHSCRVRRGPAQREASIATSPGLDGVGDVPLESRACSLRWTFPATFTARSDNLNDAEKQSASPPNRHRSRLDRSA